MLDFCFVLQHPVPNVRMTGAQQVAKEGQKTQACRASYTGGKDCPLSFARFLLPASTLPLPRSLPHAAISDRLIMCGTHSCTHGPKIHS